MSSTDSISAVTHVSFTVPVFVVKKIFVSCVLGVGKE